MGLYHCFDGIGNDFSACQRVFHSVVSHSDSVANADGIEDERNAACFDNAFFDALGDFVEVDVSGDDIDVGGDDGDERFVEVLFLDTASAEQGAVGSAGIALFNGIGTHRNGKKRNTQRAPF